MSFTIIIPARAASTRLPDKALLDIEGLPMVVRTARQAAQSAAQRIVIATDDARIAQVASDHAIEVIMTRNDHPSGTDRLAEATVLLGLAQDEIVVNVQGDEPLIDPDLIDAVAELLSTHPSSGMATCASPISETDKLFDPNIVKVVCNDQQHALYFSRAPIPWARDALADGARRLARGLPAWHHIGLYAYRVHFLQLFPTLPAGRLEQFEALEQLRVLESGHSILVYQHDRPVAHGVDTASDLERVRQTLRQDKPAAGARAGSAALRHNQKI